MNKEQLIAFEEDIKDLFLDGKILAPVHLSRGNETPLIKIFKEIKKDDWVFSTHRSHYHALLKGISPEWIKQEILTGSSIHLNNREHNFFSSAIVGGCLPIALGVAMAIKRRGEDRKVWAVIGDMAFETGIAHEVIKYAKNFNLPLCVVVECNNLSTNTPTDVAWGFTEEHKPDGRIKTIARWGSGKVLTFCYTRGFPHIGVGQWVTFS